MPCLQDALRREEYSKQGFMIAPSQGLEAGGARRLWNESFFSAPQLKRGPLGSSHTPSDGGILRNRIFGGIGVLWGGALLVSKLVSGRWVNGSGAYASGQIVGLVFAIL